jgi:hypothetical protein
MVVWTILTMEEENTDILADSQRKGVIIGRPLGRSCGDVKYAN